MIKWVEVPDEPELEPEPDPITVPANFDELLLEKKWRKCAPPWSAGPEALLGGFTYFCTNYWCIRHPERGKLAAMKVFHWSITYLTIVFVAVAVDPFLPL